MPEFPLRNEQKTAYSSAAPQRCQATVGHQGVGRTPGRYLATRGLWIPCQLVGKYHRLDGKRLKMITGWWF